MNAPDESDKALANIVEIAGDLSAPVKKSFSAALGQLLGGVAAIPTVWLRRLTQPTDDINVARSIVSTGLAKAVLDKAVEDQEVMKVAAEIYLPTVVRKARNRVLVAQAAAEQLSDERPLEDEPSEPDEGWMNHFTRFAEDVSLENMQTLFGKILAGEIVRPKSFGIRTLRTVSEIDQKLAEDFSWMWSKGIGEVVEHTDELSKGEGWSLWQRLVDGDLMAPNSAAQYLPAFVPLIDGCGLWMPFSAGDSHLLIRFRENSNIRARYISFTKVGRELGSILPPPDYVNNLRMLGKRLPKTGLVKIELFRQGQEPEIIWEENSR